MSRPFSAAGAALILVLLAAGPAGADPSFQYSWSVSPGTITTVSASDLITPGTGTITLTSPGGPFTAVGGTDTVAATVKAVSTALSTNPDVIPLQLSGNYTLTLSLTDQASQTSASVSFTGMLSGTLSATGNNTQNLILGTTDSNGSNPGQTEDVVVLGNTAYTVAYTGYLAPGLLAEGSLGGIGFNINTTPATPTGSPLPGAIGLPEPGSAVLAVVGTILSALATRRRRAVNT
jgi:hypothetical protein